MSTHPGLALMAPRGSLRLVATLPCLLHPPPPSPLPPALPSALPCCALPRFVPPTKKKKKKKQQNKTKKKI